MGRLAVILIILLFCPVVTFVHEVKCSDFSAPIFIKADGSIDPPSAPIQRNGDVYTLTDDINMTAGYGIVIQRGSAVLDGANRTISAMVHSELCYGIGILAGNVTVKNVNIRNFWMGIRIYSSSSTIVGNRIEESFFFGIWVESNYSSISSNHIANSEYGGLGLSIASFNEITSNNIDGIVICESSRYNLIVGNDLSKVRFEAYAPSQIENNSIYHNHIMAPVDQPTWVKQNWDDGYPSGGNLWDYYLGFDLCSGFYQNETGSDGIGDTPYEISANNTDRYPWMMMRTPTPVLPVAKMQVYAPARLKVDDIVIFNASHSVCGWNGTHPSPIKEYIWDFGDGNVTSTNERAIEHTFGSGMYFEVWLTVVDLEGRNSSAHTTIRVMMPTSISISTTSPSSFIGFVLDISGALIDIHEQGLNDKTVLLSYTFPGASSWFPITSSLTDDSGVYSAQWIPTATGYFTIKAEWAGNSTYLEASSTVALSILPYENQYVFTVESNSTISDLTFDSNSHRLSFALDGENGTTGYTKVTIARSLAPDITKLKVHVDKTEYEYTVTNTTDSWVLFFVYNHSIHQIEIDLGQSPIPEFSSIEIIALLVAIYGAIVSTVKVVSDYLSKSRRFKVTVSSGFLLQGTNVGSQQVIISATNTGFSDITLTSAGLVLPDGKYMMQVEPTSDVVFLFTLAGGKQCSIYKGQRALVLELRKQSYSGKIKLRGFYRSATGVTRMSKGFAFDIDTLPAPGE